MIPPGCATENSVCTVASKCCSAKSRHAYSLHCISAAAGSFGQFALLPLTIWFWAGVSKLTVEVDSTVVLATVAAEFQTYRPTSIATVSTVFM